MFDQNDQNQPAQDAAAVAPAVDPAAAPAADLQAPAVDPTTPPSAPLPDPTMGSDASTYNTTVISAGEPPIPAAPVLPEVPAISADPIAAPVLPDPVITPTVSAPAPAVSGDLLGIKQNALQSLTPLLDHLEQSPEEKFRTTMMMIQASDDQSLVQAAYDAANAITDEKAKAQALLDVVNEINYFTQQAKPAGQA